MKSRIVRKYRKQVILGIWTVKKVFILPDFCLLNHAENYPVNTKKKLMISIASFFVPKARDRIALIKEFIEPVLIVLSVDFTTKMIYSVIYQGKRD